MRRTSFLSIASGAVLVFALSHDALAGQDRYKLKVPDGLAFAEFRGYQNWLPVAVSQTKDSTKLIAANAPMIDAYRAGVPGNGKLFPDGSKIVKIEWAQQQNTVSPYFVMAPGALRSIAFIEKDLKRFPKTHGWAYAKFDQDPASGTLKPSVTGVECGYSCHSKVANQDYTFTAYPKR